MSEFSGGAVERVPWRRPMTARDLEESSRASTPLELLFDLCFVVAVAQAATQLHVMLGEAHYHRAVAGYVGVFFGIWWAWMNFTWFASAYDNDDVLYRLLTLLQIAGVLILAAGVQNAAAHGNFAWVIAGYVVMRIAMVLQWLRASRGDPHRRAVANGYAVGIFVLQFLWVATLFVPHPFGEVLFLALFPAELIVPILAERRGEMTSWHPEHIADRYGAFTLIVIGECVSAATVALHNSITDHGLSAPLLVAAAGCLILLFGLWWSYFAKPLHQALRGGPAWGPYLWGYGHYIVFGSLGAVGAGMQVVAESLHRGNEHVGPSPTTVAYLVAIPVVLFVAMSTLLHLGLRRQLPVPRWLIGGLTCVLVLVPLATPTIGLAGAVLTMALVVAATVAIEVALNQPASGASEASSPNTPNSNGNTFAD